MEAHKTYRGTGGRKATVVVDVDVGVRKEDKEGEGDDGNA